MVEFKVSYWELGEYRDPVELSVAFSDAAVEVTATDVATFPKAHWDAVRQLVNATTHEHWATAYGGTPIREHLNAEELEAATMMAFGALHVLTPPSAEAAVLEASPNAIAAKYSCKILKDTLGNAVRVIGPLRPGEEDAANELMEKGQLQKLTVVVTPPRGPQYAYAAYFMPFHIPIVATDEISPAARALKDRVPQEPAKP